MPAWFRDSYLGTFAQSLPRMPALIRHMQPTWHRGSIADLGTAFIEEHAISGMIWDVDGTLMDHHAMTVAPSVAAQFSRLLSVPGLSHVVLSNADERRFVELGRIFPDIPILRGYRQGNRTLFRSIRGTEDSWTEAERSARLAEGAVPLRKPSGELVARALEMMGVPADRAVMVGDQYLTDVAGAGLAGVRSVKVGTIGRASFPFAVRMSQRVEWLLHRVVHGPARGR
jgi:HAD superfamily phosphatase (TIGR01668 family)